MVLSVLVARTMDLHTFEETIGRERTDKQLKIAACFYGPFTENRISVQEGMSYLSTCINEVDDLIGFYQRYLALAAVEFATLTVTCKNGSITSCDQGEWRNLDFNKI